MCSACVILTQAIAGEGASQRCHATGTDPDGMKIRGCVGSVVNQSGPATPKPLTRHDPEHPYMVAMYD